MGSAQAGSGHPSQRLSGVAHDLRSALSATVAYLDLAREALQEGKPVTAEDLAAVERGLDRIAGVLDQLEAAAKAAPQGGSP